MEEDRLKIIKAGPEEKGARIDVFIAKMLYLTRTNIQNAVESGNVKIGDKIIRKNSYRLKGNEEISVELLPREETTMTAENIPLDIIYEDDDVILLNKPAGMVVHPAYGHNSGTLVNALLGHCKKLSQIGGVSRPGIIHRLDKNTSGLLLAVKNDEAHVFLSAQMKERKIKRMLKNT